MGCKFWLLDEREIWCGAANRPPNFEFTWNLKGKPPAQASPMGNEMINKEVQTARRLRRGLRL